MTRALAEHETSGQWFGEPGRTRWWFDSGSLALDFANTGALPGSAERLHNPADLGAWLRERYESVSTDVSETELSDALGLRHAVANLALAALGRSPWEVADVDILNLFAATPDVPPSLPGSSRQAGASRLRPQQALSSIARDGIRIVQANSPGEGGTARIRQCAAEDCELVYLDTSRSGNRRWCSMQRCGNRAKVRAHRARSLP